MKMGDSSAIVTGGSSGLGEGTVEALAAAGAHVIVLDVNRDLGEAVASRVSGTFVRADVTCEEDVEAAIAAAESVGPLRVLVNCAGISKPMRTVSRSHRAYDYADFKRVIDINLLGTFNCLRLGAASMSRNDPLDDGQRGVIVNTASSAAFEGQVGQAAYSASKAGIVGMTLPIARDLAIFGIRINTIAPGLFHTPIFDGGEEILEKLLENQVFPSRAGLAREFAQLVMSTVENDFLNGSTIRLDGAARLPTQG